MPLPVLASDGRQTAGLLFEEHRAFLWGLAYRLTGNAADADDIVQETFVRALANPPADQDRCWRPWLVRVALNLGRDLLRYRRRRGYSGPWLPSPIEAEPPSHEPVDDSANPAARYDLVESVSMAFLLALEVLSPMQRAVLLLRDVFDYSAREAADALGISEANARTTHLRARRAMAAYDAARRSLDAEVKAKSENALKRFLAYVADGDMAGVESLLAADVRVLSDAGGEFHAAMVPVVGRRKVASLFIKLAQKSEPMVRSEMRMLNGLPGVVMERLPSPHAASKFVIQAELGHDGRISRIYVVLASAKLKAIG
jgi:RNA polymerase sigma-70 factor (ECF subfamily)